MLSATARHAVGRQAIRLGAGRGGSSSLGLSSRSQWQGEACNQERRRTLHSKQAPPSHSFAAGSDSLFSASSSAASSSSYTLDAQPSHSTTSDALLQRARRRIQDVDRATAASPASRTLDFFATAPANPVSLDDTLLTSLSNRQHPLTDNYQRRHSYLRISLTEKCNLRCTYCMPAEGVPVMPKDASLSADEISRLARLFVEQGVDKIRLTGGEPTLRKDLVEIIRSLRENVGLKQIGITTNGILLTRLLPQLLEAGLTHINVSIDTLDPQKFETMTRRPAAGLRKVLDGIEMALRLGVPSIKVNVVVMRGVNDDQDAIRFVEWAKDKPITVRFIEYMPFDGNQWRADKLVPYQELLQRIETHFGGSSSIKRLSDDENDTSKHWQVVGHASRIGFITSMTQHFCGTCNRLRLTADGNIKVCLFGNTEVSLRDAMRHSQATDDQLLQLIGAAVGRKHARHGGLKDLQDLASASKDNRSMIRIGG